MSSVAIAEPLSLSRGKTKVRARRREAVRAQATEGVWIEVGQAVRYRGLGSGRVLRHERRQLRGEMRVFAVISFPHRDMTAQIPLGDPAYTNKIEAVETPQALKQLLSIVKAAGDPLSRTWDGREEEGRKRLNDGGPTQWVMLLRDYASARRDGMAITSSDADLVRETVDLLSAEYACAHEIEYSVAYEKVFGVYAAASA